MLRSQIIRWLMWTLQAIMLAGLILTIIEQHWLDAFLIVWVMLLAMLPSLLSRRFKVYVPPEFELLAILFLFASLFLGEVRGYYLRFWWWDAALHTGSGFLLGTLGFMLVYILNQEEDIQLYMTPAFVALFSFVFALAVGALWEITEYGIDAAFGLNMQKSGLRDTMWDLIVDAIGALVMAILGYFYMKRGRGSFIFTWVERFVDRNPKLFRRAIKKAELHSENE